MSQNPPFIHSILLVALGAALTGGGAIVANQLSEDRKSRHDYEMLRRERFEELYELTVQMANYELEHTQLNVGVSDATTDIKNPIDRIETLVAIYFPDLKPYVVNLRVLSSGFDPQMLEIRKEPDLTKRLDKMGGVRKPFLTKLWEFQSAIADEASATKP